MDSNKKPNSAEKSQSKSSRPSNSRSRQPNRNPSSHTSRNTSRERNRNTNRSRDRGHHHTSGYRNSGQHPSRSGGNPERIHRKKNFNSNLRYNQNARRSRGGRWNSGPRYGNLSWQRRNANQSDELLDPKQLYDRFLDTAQTFGRENQQDFRLDDVPESFDQFIIDAHREHSPFQQYHGYAQGSTEEDIGWRSAQKVDNLREDTRETEDNNFFQNQDQGFSESRNNYRKGREPTNQNFFQRQRDNIQSEEAFANQNQFINDLRELSAETLRDNQPRNRKCTQNQETKNQLRVKSSEVLRESSSPIQSFVQIHEPNEQRNHSLIEESAINHETSVIKTEPVALRTDDLIFDIKTEEPACAYADFSLESCLNGDIDNQFPSISVIPISRLIKSELQELNRTDIIATNPTRGRPTLRPNLVKRRKKSLNEDGSGTLSENLVQRVANMDKVGIKNVINNTGTKFDAALKLQARKKLREEIRKQLKSMNFTPPENSENSVLVPDEIVDSMNIPAVVLDEIRKAFGIVLVDDVNIAQPTEKTDTPKGMAKSSNQTERPFGQETEKTIAPKEVATKPPNEKDRPSTSPDLKSRLKMLEEVKSHTEKVSPVRAVLSPKKHSKSKPNEDVVVINSSSSSSSSSSSDTDSDTSSTSSASNSSTTSSFKRRRRKKRILEANVVGNFEKLILPNLTTAQRRRYKEKYSKTTKGSLMYIYGVCVSRANSNTVDPKEKLKLKRNLSTADNAQALEFLMKAILSLFEEHKEKRRKDKAKSTSLSKPEIKSEPPNPVSSTKTVNDSTCNQGKSDDEQGRVQSESANATKNIELPKHQSTKLDKAPPPAPSEGGVNRNDGDSIAESANSAQGVAADGILVADNSDSDSDFAMEGGGDPPSSSRQWKSPGEKKCIETEQPSPISGLTMMQPPLGLHAFDLDSLKSKSTIGNEAVNNIREIDVKLMELHKRKIYIEEMILKLQKDKMEVDLYTMKLQNEKFILLNTALASASSNSTAVTSPKMEKKTKQAEKRKPFSTPFSEKLRNRKKRCQRDILLEETDKAMNANKPPGEASDIAKLMRKPRQTRHDTRISKIHCEIEQATAKQTIKIAGEVKAAEPAKEKEKEIEEPTTIKNVELPQVDYTDVPNGNLEGWKLPITQIIVVGEAIVAASEDGNIYKFNIRTRVLESKFSKHTEAITQIFTCPKENFVYTTSLDGFLKKTSIENFGLEIQSLNLQEPLQSIDIEWGTAYIGSRWGNIFTYDIKNNNLSESLLCSSGSSIIAIKATKEGPRKILIVSSKGNQIDFRDAISGLLLRSLDVPDNLHIYSILLDDGCVFCGTQRNEIHQYNFTTGGRLAIFHCGNGAVSMKLYKDKYIFVGCYDGFVYVLDKGTGCQLGRFPGSGKMILALEIAGDKLITSAKDNTMQIIDIPKYIVTKDKS